MLLRSCLGAPLIVAVLCLARTAGAQQEDADLERARALFDRAGELERQGQWPAAQENLRTALRIRETPNLRYALGWALENDDQLLAARTEYELALRLAQRAGSEEVAKLAAQRIAEVDRKTPLVQVRIRGQVARGTRVLVDGREVVIRGDAGTVPVDPGTRLVRVEREGRSPTEQSVSVSRGVLRVVELKGDDSISVHDENGATTDRGTALPWVLVGGGVVLERNGARLWLAGADDPARGLDGPAAFLARTVADALSPCPADITCKVLLSHRPRAFDTAPSHGATLTLSGHTHGAQMALFGRSWLQPLWPESFLLGHYTRRGQTGTSHLYTSAGLGHWMPFRLNCPCETVLITLRTDVTTVDTVATT